MINVCTHGLINPVVNLPISAVRRESDGVSIVCDSTNADIPAGTYVREFGIYASETGGNEFLFAYAYTYSPEVVPPRSESVYERRFISHLRMTDDEASLVIVFDSIKEAVEDGTGLSIVNGKLCITYEEE